MTLRVGFSEVLSAISTVVSVMAFSMSIYSTKKTVKFNERQNAFIETNDKLNKMLLDKEKQEGVVQRQADISASFIKIGKGYRLKVFNRGKSTATNVRIEFPTGNEILIDDEIAEKFPMPTLEPQQSVELIAAVHMQSPRRMELKFIWDDPSNCDREKVLNVTL